MEKNMKKLNTEEKTPILTGQVRNANSRTIFKNALLTSQFLRDYTNISIFSDIKPEDVEDVTDHYRAFLGIEFDTDTVKKVRVTIDGKPQDVFVLPLIEHKSYVDYDVAMQILRYMSVIWYTYAKQQNAIHTDSSHTKRFRYPPIIPIVYYEGKDTWTAHFHLKDRIENAEKLNGYVPDFQYHLVNCRDYTKEELESRHDEMSLVMLINRIQSPGDYSEFFEKSKEYAVSVYDNASEDIKQVYSEIIWSLMMKMNIPVEEARELMEQLEVGGMGYLFENAEKMDIQAERQNTKEAREAAEAAEKRANAAKQEANQNRQKMLNLEQMLNLVIGDLIQQGKASGKTKEEMQKSFQENYGLKESEARQKIEQFWK